jgi:hypothetical protein
MPHPVDDQTTSDGRTAKETDSFVHHVDFNRIPLKRIRAHGHFIPNNRTMLRQAIEQTVQVGITRSLA